MEEQWEIYRLSEDEIQHFGVKGMKWGKRKSRSSYMKKVDAHEAKTSARRDAKKAASKAKYEQEKADFANGKKAVKQAGKNYIERNKAKEVARLEKRVETKAKFKNDVKTTVKKMRDASEMIEAESQAKRDAKKAASKAKYEQEKSDFKQVKLSKDEKDAIAEEKFWAKDAKEKAWVERHKARMAKVMGQKAVDVLTAPENRVKIAAVTSILAAYAGTQMGSAKNARLMREFNSHNYKI